MACHQQGRGSRHENSIALWGPICKLGHLKRTFLPSREARIVYRFVFAIACLFLLLSPSLRADESDAKSGDKEKYLLRYSLDAGEQVRYEVTHVAKTKTRIRGAEELSQVHTVSQRHLDVVESEKSKITFNHIVDSVEMTQQQGEAEEVRWNSRDEETPPAVFEKVAEQLGKTLSTVSVDARGQELTRKDNGGTKASLGMGSLTLTLPEQPMAIGESWSASREVKTRTENGEVKTIKIRELYTLEKVKTGVATLSIKSEPLTPIKDESVRAQVVQQLSNGTIRFDIDNGRMLSKQLDWGRNCRRFPGREQFDGISSQVDRIACRRSSPHRAPLGTCDLATRD